MTISRRTKSTQKSKMQLVDFVGWIVQRFRQFSSDFSSSLPPYFRPGQSSLFTCCWESGKFFRLGFDLPWVSFFQCLSKICWWFFHTKLFYGNPFLHLWSPNFALACGSPASVDDHVSTSKDYTNIENDLCSLLRLSCAMVPTFFIRFFFKSSSIFSRPCQLSLFICCLHSLCFHWDCFYLPGVPFCDSFCNKFEYLSYKTYLTIRNF